MHYSLVIIGGGPIGIACALEAKKHNLDYLILEKGTLVNSLYNYPVNMTFFSTSERLEIGTVPFVSNNPKPTRNEALEYYRRVAQDNRVNIHLFEKVIKINPEDDSKAEDTTAVGHATRNEKQETRNAKRETKNEKPAYRTGRREIIYRIQTTQQAYTATYIIIATGFYDIPYLLNVPGEELPKVKHYYNDPHFYAFQKVVVVGASNSAVDAALETWRKGAEVTMVIRQSQISERVKYWVRPDIENRIKEGSIKAYFNSSVASIREKEIDLQTTEGVRIIANDWVLAMTGYQPNLAFLKDIGIELSTDAVLKPTYNEETHESNCSNIYLAGVICGGMNTHRLFIENSREHAEKIIRNIRGKKGQ